ncbi:MAG TPA: hypothetical protein VHE37_13465, partial [Nevskiaceae bacterium]|nr:hypothetical protein [Nevskiaceae bacterium]
MVKQQAITTRSLHGLARWMVMSVLLLGLVTACARREDAVADLQQKNLLIEQLQLPAAGAEPQQLAQMTQAIKSRAESFKQLVRTYPGSARSAMLDARTLAALRAQFPQLSKFLESEGSWSGDLVPVHFDNFDARVSVDGWMLHSMDGRADLAPVDAALLRALGKQAITVSGIRIGDVIAVESALPRLDLPRAGRAKNYIATSSAAAPGDCTTVGEQDFAVILMGQPDSPAFPLGAMPVSFWQQQYFSTTPRSLNSFWHETSYGQASAAGQVFGPYDFDQNYSCSDSGSIYNSALAAAKAAGADLSPYSRVSIVFAENSCWYGGLGEVGCGGADENIPHPYSVNWIPVSGTGSNAWDIPRVLFHESGHNLGLSHANTLDFGSIPLGAIDYTATNPGTVTQPDTMAPDSAGGSAVNEEYADPYSAMDGSSNLHSYSAFAKVMQLGWIPFGDRREVTAAGSYVLAP